MPALDVPLFAASSASTRPWVASNRIPSCVTKPRRPCGLVLRIHTRARDEHGVLGLRVETYAAFRVVEPDFRDVVVANLHAERILYGVSSPHGEPAVGHLHARDEAAINLFLLVAVHGIVEEEREVRDEVQVVRESVAP